MGLQLATGDRLAALVRTLDDLLGTVGDEVHVKRLDSVSLIGATAAVGTGHLAEFAAFLQMLVELFVIEDTGAPVCSVGATKF